MMRVSNYQALRRYIERGYFDAMAVTAAVVVVDIGVEQTGAEQIEAESIVVAQVDRQCCRTPLV